MTLPALPWLNFASGVITLTTLGYKAPTKMAATSFRFLLFLLAWRSKKIYKVRLILNIQIVFYQSAFEYCNKQKAEQLRSICVITVVFLAVISTSQFPQPISCPWLFTPNSSLLDPLLHTQYETTALHWLTYVPVSFLTPSTPSFATCSTSLLARPSLTPSFR